MASYSIEKCVSSDAEVLAKTHLASSVTAPRFHVTCGACSQVHLLSMWAHEFREAISSGDVSHDSTFQQKHRYLKAVVSTTNEIAAYASWYIYPTTTTT